MVAVTLRSDGIHCRARINSRNLKWLGQPRAVAQNWLKAISRHPMELSKVGACGNASLRDAIKAKAGDKLTSGHRTVL